MMRVSFDGEQLSAFKHEVVRGKPYAQRISAGLAFRLAEMYVGRSDHFAVLDELDHLEGLSPASRTKPESQFRRAPLHPLWHKHFSSARHVAENIRIRWNLGGNGNRDLHALGHEIADAFGDDTEAWPAHYADRIVRQGYEDRVDRGLTGDWIVFGKHGGLNYYLDIATHEEGEDANAANLLRKIKNASAAEFPFLFLST
jgi:hypothetical protein